ncbi:unnamed protein product [Polarella glacialis]|uniref:Uncharacterized protein n=1 Tax=Polarella glacialis TaxID=89957 RepID=A0A813ILW5_POLGL|nr:unnamed protein product [Polarella glacialis]
MAFGTWLSGAPAFLCSAAPGVAELRPRCRGSKFGRVACVVITLVVNALLRRGRGTAWLQPKERGVRPGGLWASREAAPSCRRLDHRGIRRRCGPGGSEEVATQDYDALFREQALQDLRGKWALISGASSGIGKATACALAACGCNVALLARRTDRLEALRAEILRRKGGEVQVKVVAGDVRNDETYAELRATGCLDVDFLVNNAGLAKGKSLVGSAQISEWKEMLDINCLGAFRLTNEVLPAMISRGTGGHVIMTGSIAGLEAYEGGSVYSASKHAVHAFMKALRYENYQNNIRCTVVAPGLVGEGTEFSTVRFDGDAAAAAKVYENIQELKASDVAAQIVWALRQPPHVCLDMIHVMPTSQGGVEVSLAFQIVPTHTQAKTARSAGSDDSSAPAAITTRLVAALEAVCAKPLARPTADRLVGKVDMKGRLLRAMVARTPDIVVTSGCLLRSHFRLIAHGEVSKDDFRKLVDGKLDGQFGRCTNETLRVLLVQLRARSAGQDEDCEDHLDELQELPEQDQNEEEWADPADIAETAWEPPRVSSGSRRGQQSEQAVPVGGGRVWRPTDTNEQSSAATNSGKGGRRKQDEDWWDENEQSRAAANSGKGGSRRQDEEWWEEDSAWQKKEVGGIRKGQSQGWSEWPEESWTEDGWSNNGQGWAQQSWEEPDTSKGWADGQWAPSKGSKGGKSAGKGGTGDKGRAGHGKARHEAEWHASSAGWAAEEWTDPASNSAGMAGGKGRRRQPAGKA